MDATLVPADRVRAARAAYGMPAAGSDRAAREGLANLLLSGQGKWKQHLLRDHEAAVIRQAARKGGSAGGSRSGGSGSGGGGGSGSGASGGSGKKAKVA